MFLFKFCNYLSFFSTFHLCSVLNGHFLFIIVGDSNAEGPPVPIPNTEVKLCSGENTCLATDREDSSLLTQRLPFGKAKGLWLAVTPLKISLERVSFIGTKNSSLASSSVAE